MVMEKKYYMAIYSNNLINKENEQNIMLMMEIIEKVVTLSLCRKLID